MTNFDAKFPSAITSGAFRIPPMNAKPPSLTWNMAFWNPQKPKEKHRNPRGDRERLCGELDNFIVDLFNGLEADPSVDSLQIFPSDRDDVVLFNDAYEIHAQGTDIKNRKYLKKLDKSQSQDERKFIENIKMQERRLVLLSFVWRCINFEFRCELRTEYFVFTIFANIAESEGKTREKYECLKELLRLDPEARKTCQEKLANLEKARKVRQYFRIDFWKKFGELIDANCKTDFFTTANPILSQRFCDFKGVCLPAEINNEVVGEDANWGKVICTNMVDVATERDFYECTATYMAGRRLLYMTDLGQSVFNIDNTEAGCVFFLVIVKTSENASDALPDYAVNEWQLGRVLHRIHMLGTVRLAAVRQIDAIRQASILLSELDPYMKDARASVKDQNVTEVRKRFSLVTETYLEIDPTKSGLQYRVERSRYYVNIFRENVNSLRIRRMEGYQKYNDFVERKMGEQFDFIDRVGTRYERAAVSLSLIEQTYQAESISDIQRWGELVLIGFLLPYYVASFFHLLTEDQFMPDVRKEFFKFAMLCAALVAYVVAAIRFVGTRRVLSEEGLIKLFFMICLYVMVGLLLVEISDNYRLLTDHIVEIWTKISTAISERGIGK